MAEFRGVELSELTLSSDTLALRRWRPDDADRVFEVMQDPSMREFLALPEPYSHEVASEFVGGIGHEGRDDGTGIGSAVVERASGRVVGAAALRLAGDPEIGYWVAPDARGHGHAAAATRMLVRWGFGVGLSRIGLACDVRNLGSIRTAMAAGFRFEGVARDGIASAGSGGVRCYRGDLARFARLAPDAGEPIPPAFPPLPGGSLSDGVVAVRPARPDDAQGYHETEDELTVRWSFDGRPRAGADATRATTHAGMHWLVGREARCSIVDLASGSYAGELQLRAAGPPGVGGIGYVVHPRFRGLGYTARALRLFAPWAFDIAGFARLELGAKRDNVASQRAAGSAGFEPDGVRARRMGNADGSFGDEVCFALVNPRVR